MPSKRDILVQLTRDDLLDNLEYYDLEVADRRVKAQLVDALASSRQASIEEIMGDLSRDTLKTLCRHFDLDDAGREKAVLVERLTGRAPRPASRDARDAPLPTQATTQERTGSLGFENKLWEAAALLRNNMDPAEYKHVVLGLLFLKYIEDAFDERREELRSAVADADSDYSSTRTHARRSLRPFLKTATNTPPRTSSGCQRPPGGRISRPRRRNRRSAKPSTMRWMRSSARIRH